MRDAGAQAQTHQQAVSLVPGWRGRRAVGRREKGVLEGLVPFETAAREHDAGMAADGAPVARAAAADGAVFQDEIGDADVALESDAPVEAGLNQPRNEAGTLRADVLCAALSQDVRAQPGPQFT